MNDQIIINAANAIVRAMQNNPAWHIGKHSDGSTAFDTDKLQDELESGLMPGWCGIKEVRDCALWQWSAAMQLIINQERSKAGV